MATYTAVWLANVTGMDGSKRPAYCRICEGTAYREDDEFVVGWRDDVEAQRPEDVPEIVFARHNADSRPSGQTCRSMSVATWWWSARRPTPARHQGSEPWTLHPEESGPRRPTFVEFMDGLR